MSENVEKHPRRSSRKWVINGHCDNVIEPSRPHIILIHNKEQKGIIINIAVPTDARVEEKEREKV